MSPKSRDHNYWSASSSIVVGSILLLVLADGLLADMQMVPAPLTACQHLRQAETRRSRALRLEPDNGRRAPVLIPKCTRSGDFEPVQCSNEIGSPECWCVDAYGQEIGGTRRENDADEMRCSAALPEDQPDSGNSTVDCPASSCRMFCPAGFARDAQTGCPMCACRDPCSGIECPGGHSCQLQEVACVNDPCPPVPTCKKARSLTDLCPAGQPLTIADTPRPFLCGHEPGKPQCPPIYRCMVQSGNDYGVCCPAGATVAIRKPGSCPRPNDFPRTEYAGRLCGSPCSADLDCPNAEKCCETDGCSRNCRAPSHVSACQQARVVAEMMSIGEREGRGYVPECDERVGGFTRRQCSRNGLVCWCVDPMTGHKVRDSMGAASSVTCEPDRNGLDASVQSQSRQFGAPESTVPASCGEPNICAAVCEYGFKVDHDGCPTCECSEPCEGFRCAAGAHCEVARDVRCASASALCASEPVCKPDLVYTNPCATGVPLASNATGEFLYCKTADVPTPEFQTETYWDASVHGSDESRALSDLTECPAHHQCVKLFREGRSVCCPAPVENETDEAAEESRPQSMCEYLRDFSDRMEGTESGMILALPSPTCKPDGHFEPRICVRKTVRVTRSQRKRLLEEQNVREMRALFERGSRRSPRSAGHFDAPSNLKLYKVADGDSTVEPKLDVPALIRYLRQHGNTAHSEANYMAEILSRKLLSQAIQERSAKLIDGAHPIESQLLTGEKPIAAALTSPARTRTRPSSNNKRHHENDNELVSVDVDECYCVDGFGTEIPQSRGSNVTLASCAALRESLECLDITCRMGCDYGFVLDPQTRCPTCECRDPCDSIECSDGHECRSVEVSCEGEYCPPVPACLPRKPGQCPFLVPPGTEGSTIDSCEYECRSDQHCPGARRCCSNGCGTQCVEPQLKTACQHLQTIQLHQASEVGVPARQKYIVQCNATSGAWLRRQCGPGGEWCWCVDAMGNELSGTRRSGAASATMNCDGTEESAVQVTPVSGPQSRRNDACVEPQCGRTVCEFGYLLDENGCRTCSCRDPCSGIACPGGERCQLMRVECIDQPCPQMPICVPQRDESVCSEGLPFRRNGQDVICGPQQSDADACPTTHTCQLDVISRRGVCCAKTRDVCFEAVNSSCAQNITGHSLSDALLMWRFSPKQNKCVQMLTDRTCASKNLFHSESACKSVCPVLSACERLRLRNSLAAKRQNMSNSWFQPNCDPETGAWAPIQCLGRPTAPDTGDRRSPNGVSRAFSVSEPNTLAATVGGEMVGVCWCADKKGAPMPGSLTRGTEPSCTHRQARRRQHLPADESPADRSSASAILRDPMIEQLIGQITLIADEDQLIQSTFDDDRLLYDNTIRNDAAVAAVTERIMAIAYATDHASVDASADGEWRPQPALRVERTRCQAIRDTVPALFPVRCTASGSFEPMQCNDESVCWCVDMAGNQLPQSGTFGVGAPQSRCPETSIDRVSVELHLPNTRSGRTFRNLYDLVREELRQLFDGEIPDNLRVHEQPSSTGGAGAVHVQFDLADGERGPAVDTAFALEELVRQGGLALVGGQLVADQTLSRFTHHAGGSLGRHGASSQTGGRTGLPDPVSMHIRPENAFQMIVFVLATSSAFLVSIFVVYVMLKRGKSTKQHMLMMGAGVGGVGGAHPAAASGTLYDPTAVAAMGGGKRLSVGSGDKYLDYSSPIFVLSASDMKIVKDDDSPASA